MFTVAGRENFNNRLNIYIYIDDDTDATVTKLTNSVASDLL